MKKARNGDVQPGFMGVSLQHARYFRQLRRLQSLCCILQKDTLTWNGTINRDETWRAIRCAVGFPGVFGLWWGRNGLQPTVTAPLPLWCPSLDFLQGLFQGFHQYMQRYEASLISHRYQFAKQRRVNHMSYVFQDCKEDPLPQADTLIDRVAVDVEETRSEDNSLVLVHPVSLLPDVPVVVDGHVVQVVAHAEDQVWLDTLPDVKPGSVLTQERALVTDEAILQRFAAVWTSRRVKHAHVQPGQWDQICGFLERTARPLTWKHTPWTLERLDLAIRQKKPRAAKGPDGVSQPDLLALPPQARVVLMEFFVAVEAGSSWPAQLASGFVTSLAKHASAQSVDEFRPVAVYSLPYRIWSSERARKALQSIACLLPESIKGGVPQRQAKSIWFELAYTLEKAYLDGQGLHGLLMDIQKCFNNIPRQPLWYALKLLGFPVSILRAWVSFVSGQTRRFRVRQSVGEPLPSNCGLPEGCALSVFGMAIVDWMLDWWLQGLDVTVDLRTFVDDWGVLFRDASALGRVWSAMEQFTGHLHLAIDMKKARLWSTEAEARREFRDSSIEVTLAARNLGAHQNFSRHSHNAELQKRLAQMPQVWIRLKASHASYKQKIMVIHMMAWPRALHGITVVHLGESHFKVLRSGAARSLKADRKGANPYLHLASTHFQTDPEAWAILQTFRDVRELGTRAQVEPTLGLFATSLDKLPNNGPSAILLSRLRRLGWGVGSQGLIQDRFGTFSLMSIAWDELLLRFKYAWGHVLSTELAHRNTFHGLDKVDLSELYGALASFGPVDQVFLRCHLDGTLFTQNGRAKFSAGVTSQCPWCSATDGFHHRAWICPHFAPCRAHLTQEQLDALALLPPCLRDHGWSVTVAEWEVFAVWLLQDDGLCRMSPVEPSVRSLPHLLEVFVDGTSACPHEPKLRFAAWAATVVPGGVGTLDNQFLMGGYVKGFSQTPFRAELTAVLQVTIWAVQRRRAIRIWCDCQGVVKGFLRITRGRSPRRNAPHSGLWGLLYEVLQGFEHLVQIRKVVSHGSLRSSTGPLEDWAYWHNNVTDAAAEGVNYRRPSAFWRDWVILNGALSFHRKLHRAILLVLLQTSRMANVRSSRPVAMHVVPQAVIVEPTLPAEWKIPGSLVKRYGADNLAQLHTWWTRWGPAMMQGDQPLTYISGVQLFLSFQLHTGYEGPWCHNKKWYSRAEDAPVSARRPWGERVKLFLLLFRSYLKGNKVILSQRMTRPHSAAVAKWLICYRLRWPTEMVDYIDSHVFTSLGRQACNAADLAALRATQTG